MLQFICLQNIFYEQACDFGHSGMNNEWMMLMGGPAAAATFELI